MSKFFEAKGELRKEILQHVDKLVRREKANREWVRKNFGRGVRPAYMSHVNHVIGIRCAHWPDSTIWKRSRTDPMVYLPRANKVGKEWKSKLKQRTKPSREDFCKLVQVSYFTGFGFSWPGWQISKHLRPRVFVEISDQSKEPSHKELKRVADLTVEKAMSYRPRKAAA